MPSQLRDAEKKDPERGPLGRMAGELRRAADRREAHDQPVTAILFRNEALRIESADGRLSL